MRSPALGIAWKFWRPHRWWFVATATYVVTLALVFQCVGVQVMAQWLGETILAEALAQKALVREELAHLLGLVSACPVAVGLVGPLVVFGYGMHTNLRI